MITLTLILLLIISFQLGCLVSWSVFDYKFYRPQRRLLQRALGGWGETLEALEENTPEIKKEE